jgi:hypothetical protein
MTLAVWSFIRDQSLPTRVMIVGASAVCFGASLTSYVMFMPGHQMQVLASCLKVPALLLLSPLIAVYPTLFLSKFLDRNVRARALLKASFSCVFWMAICLALIAPLVAVINTFGNYTVVIFVSYAAFAAAGVIGCIAFYHKLNHIEQSSRSSNAALKIAAIWSVLFGLAGAEVGWSIRPFVGWTGQPFEWYRADNTRMWQQLNTEAQNLGVGGLSYPSKLENPP